MRCGFLPFLVVLGHMGGASGAAAEESAKGESPGRFLRTVDDDETIYVVQRKAYLVRHRVELSPLVSASFTDQFVQTFAASASGSYHLSENFALEVFGSFMFPEHSSATKELRDRAETAPELAKLTQMRWAVGLGAQWSPIYGKMELFGHSLGNFSFYMGMGLGMGQTRVSCTPGDRFDPQRGLSEPECLISEDGGDSFEPSTLRAMGTLSTGVRFFFSEWLGVKLEIKDWVFVSRVFRAERIQDGVTKAPVFSDAVRNNFFVQLGISVLLGDGDG